MWNIALHRDEALSEWVVTPSLVGTDRVEALRVNKVKFIDKHSEQNGDLFAVVPIFIHAH